MKALILPRWLSLLSVRILPSLRFLLLKGSKQFGKSAGIVKLLVNRSKADVGYIVNFQQLAHDHLADFPRGYLSGAAPLEFPFNFVNGSLDLLGGDRSLFASLHHANLNFLAVEKFSASILFDDPNRVGDQSFVGREAHPAIWAKSPPPNCGAVVNEPRVNDLRSRSAATRAKHE